MRKEEKKKAGMEIIFGTKLNNFRQKRPGICMHSRNFHLQKKEEKKTQKSL